jgi:hypothetical protein
MLYATVFGCNQYPSAYPYIVHRGNSQCIQPVAAGWMGALLLVCVVIIGGMVLPTILIGNSRYHFHLNVQQCVHH